jgi:hypothetical protein
MARALKEKVEAILRDRPETRNNDKLLVMEYWRTFHEDSIARNEIGDWVLLSSLIDLTAPEGITRARRLIQHKDKKYPATDPVVIERRKREKGVRFTINKEDNPDQYLPE